LRARLPSQGRRQEDQDGCRGESGATGGYQEAPAVRASRPCNTRLDRRRRFGWGQGRGRGVESRILTENRGLQLLQLPSGLDPDLLDQQPSSVQILLERVSLTPGPVERQHQVRTQPLAVGILANKGLQLGYELGGVSKRKL